MAALFWPVRQLRSENFVFYFPSGVRLLALESVGNAKYLPLLQVLNMVGKVGGIQEKKNSLKVWFGSNQIELTSNQPNVQIGNASYNLTHPVHVTDGQWMVPVDFLTTVLPHLTHQTAEYQEGTDRIFMGDVKFASFSVRVDPLPDGARLSVQFTDKVAVRTASSNGKWVVFLGNHPMQPVEPSYHFQNPYLSQLQYDDQDGVPKLILSPAATGLNFYPAMAKGGRVLLADIVKPPSPVAQGVPQQAAPVPPPANTPSAAAGPTPQVAQPSPAAPPGPPLPVVALDAGDGGDNTGARSRDGVLGKNLVVQYVARVQAALLKTNNYRVVLTRPGDVDATFEQRALAANLAGPACFLSFHAGDLGTASPRITIFTFQPPTAPAPVAGNTMPSTLVPWRQVQEPWLGSSLQLAQALQQQLGQINGAQVDPPATAPVRTLRSVNAPAVAIELGRLAPDADATPLTDPAFQQHVADAVVRAIAGFAKGGN